ncbi:hypothetical protein L596_001678 [Steinernema carpocapsae]|uniref:Uncharacterized protein n=1 Tax=Steinernema carpocapsae TaxID=34508 RepID=A0A4U8UMG1_STECR|nr:hypothetical protein L596_001678 [Steinernema carpocapsae]
MIPHSLIACFFLSHVFLLCASTNSLNHERSRQILCLRGYSQFCSGAAILFDSSTPPEPMLESQDRPLIEPPATSSPPRNESNVFDTRSEFRSFKEHNFAITGQEPPSIEEGVRSRTRNDERREQPQPVDRATVFESQTPNREQIEPTGANPNLAQQTKSPTVLEEMFIQMLTHGDGDPTGEQEKLLTVSHARLKKLCWKYYPAAKVHCFRRRIKKKFLEKCSGYMEDCRRFVYPQNPVDEASQVYQSNVRLSYYNQVVLPMYNRQTASYTFDESSNSNRWYNQNEWAPLG